MDNIRKGLAELLRVGDDLKNWEFGDGTSRPYWMLIPKRKMTPVPHWQSRLRTALAKQPSVREPLTDERIVELAEACGYDGAVPTVRLAFHGFRLREFARAIEAMHGIATKD